MELDMNRIPTHIAIIMDGNGRWAKKRFLPRLAGHKAGTEGLREIIRTCSDLNVKYLTVYAFSTENWGRPEDEVAGLFNLLRVYIDAELGNLHKEGVRIETLGDISKMPVDVRKKIEDAKNKTKDNTNLQFNIALNYGSRDEILKGVQSIADQVAKGQITCEEITEDLMSQSLYTRDMPDPDLLIRTSGELRLSNFLLWQLAYSEFYFTDVFWPDFRKEELIKAIKVYQNRKRRFGKL